MKFFLNRHRLGILLSLFVGLIYVLPNLFFINSYYYRGLPIISADAESMYLSRINGVHKGCVLNCNSYIKEYGNIFPHFNSSISEVIVALPSILTKISTVNLKIFYDFALPALLFFLAYILIFRLVKSVSLSILGALLILFGYNLVNATALLNIPDIVDLFKFKTDQTQFLIFLRPINPQFSSVFLFVFLNVFLSTIRNKNLKWFLILGLMYGLSFYIYFFTYAYLTVVLGVCVLFYLFKREHRNAILFSGAISVGLIIAIPQFIQIFKLFNHQYYSTIPTGYLIHSHLPHLSIVGLVLLLVFIIFTYIIKNNTKTLSIEASFVSILIISCFITRNEHIISGMIMQYNHFEAYLFSPVLAIAIVFYVHSFLSKSYILKNNFLIFSLCLVIIFNAALIQYHSYKHWLPYSISTQKYVGVLEWLKENALSRSIISAPPLVSGRIPFFTDHYVLWARYAREWISVPERESDVVFARTSVSALESIGKKYNVDYFVEDKKDNLFKDSGKKSLYKDEFFIVYKANE